MCYKKCLYQWAKTELLIRYYLVKQHSFICRFIKNTKLITLNTHIYQFLNYFYKIQKDVPAMFKIK